MTRTALYHGPRNASWTVFERKADGKRRALVSVSSAADARWHENYYRTECGYAVETERVEFCATPGCDGWYPVVKVRGRRGLYRDVPCKGHSEVVETIEVAS